MAVTDILAKQHLKFNPNQCYRMRRTHLACAEVTLLQNPVQVRSAAGYRSRRMSKPCWLIPYIGVYTLCSCARCELHDAALLGGWQPVHARRQRRVFGWDCESHFDRNFRDALAISTCEERVGMDADVE